MRNWKQKLKHDRLSKGSIDSVVTTARKKTDGNSQERLQTIFQSIKKMLSIILKFSSLEEQLKHLKSSTQMDEIDHKITKYCHNIKEEFFIIQSIELYQNEHTNPSDQQRNNLLVLHRRVRMLLRLVMPINEVISKQQQACYLKYERMIEEKGNREASISHETLLQKFESEITPKFLEGDCIEKKVKGQNEKIYSVSYCFFLEIIAIMVEQAIKVKDKLQIMIKEKKQAKKMNMKSMKSMKSCKSLKMIPNVVTTLPTSGCIFENRNEINTFQSYLKEQIYEVMDLDRIQVLVNIIPGVDYSANLSLNYDRQIKRNKKMKKDMKKFQSESFQKLIKKENKHYSQEQPQKYNSRTKGQNKRFKSQHNTLIVKNSNIRLRIVSKPKTNSENKPPEKGSRQKTTLFFNTHNQRPEKSQSKNTLISHKKMINPKSSMKPRMKLTLKIR